ncbi:hypothetical protein GCM10008927_26340 [Amylibacter ulvae]|uniref:Uncharacterized protein n=1 Tax=Paramylibacter ulvae TaxID=1651968 RepID=A0ABQ3DBH7_9RHOB|nr:hypothetical protein [Amylibacter ulvae]GHA59516.1 hypothetical protein GCM10008927_26340 [Amylibacter ulvae]
MFKEWGFLLSEWWILLALAALLGLFVGWLIWGRSRRHIDTLQAQLNGCRADLDECQADLDDCRNAKSTPVAASAVSVDMSEDFDGDGVIEGTGEGTRPDALDGPRGGVADDLKQIKGVGKKMEQLCNKLGFYHFDQIANWTPNEVAWVDANLEGFKGRVTRDKWVSQSKILAAGGSTEFSKKVEGGDVNY